MRSLPEYLREHEPEHLDVAREAARCFKPYAEDAQDYAFAEPALTELVRAEGRRAAEPAVPRPRSGGGP